MKKQNKETFKSLKASLEKNSKILIICSSNSEIEDVYEEIIGFVNSSEVVSTDFYSSPFASIIDSQATIASGKRITLYCWYDNEYGYSKQVTNLAKKIAGVNLTRLPKPIEKNI